MARSSEITLWHQVSEPVRKGHHFDAYHVVIVEIASLPTEFSHVFEQSPAADKSRTAKRMFERLSKLAKDIHLIERKHPKQCEYFVRNATLWPEGLASTGFLKLKSHRAELELLPSQKFGKAPLHPKVDDHAGYAYALLRTFFNHVLLHGNFQAFYEVNQKWTMIQNKFIEGLAGNHGRVKRTLHACLSASQGYITRLNSLADESKAAPSSAAVAAVATTGLAHPTGAFSDNESDGGSSDDEAVSAPHLAAAGIRPASARRHGLFAAALTRPADEENLFKVFQARLLLSSTITYLEARASETGSSYVGYDASEVERRNASFSKIKAQLRDPDLLDKHAALLIGFIKAEANEFFGIPYVSRHTYYNCLSGIMTELKMGNLLVSHFKAALQSIELGDKATKRDAEALAVTASSTARAQRK